jgi:hypothetical protein
VSRGHERCPSQVARRLLPLLVHRSKYGKPTESRRRRAGGFPERATKRCRTRVCLVRGYALLSNLAHPSNTLCPQRFKLPVAPRFVGDTPWDYSHARHHVHGLIGLDYPPGAGRCHPGPHVAPCPIDPQTRGPPSGPDRPEPQSRPKARRW